MEGRAELGDGHALRGCICNRRVRAQRQLVFSCDNCQEPLRVVGKFHTRLGEPQADDYLSASVRFYAFYVPRL